MTLPNTPLTVVPNGADAPTSAERDATSPAPAQDAPLALDIPHVDYNLHPLKVAGLDRSTQSFVAFATGTRVSSTTSIRTFLDVFLATTLISYCLAKMGGSILRARWSAAKAPA